MKKLIEFVKENVKSKTGINIETEIEIIQWKKKF
jgi:UDP-N-acetylenolpyruvoylglucosamine reductase